MYKKIIYLVFLICASCTLGPDYISPEVYNDKILYKELKLLKNGRIPDKWYKNWDDKNLQDLIEKGLNNNADISVAMTRLKQSRLTAKINRTDYLPQVGVKGEYDYQKGSKNIEYAQNTDYYNAGFDASWEIDIWGKGRRQSQADEANIKVSEYNLQNIKILVVSEIVVNYVNLLQNMVNLRTAKKNAELQQQISKKVEREYQNGLSNETAYNQSQYLLQTTLSEIPQYENNIEVYKNTLSSLIGILPSQISVSDTSFLRQNNFYRVSTDINNLPVSVIRLRPDVMAAEQKLKAQNALIGKAIAELYPDLSISGVFGYSSSKGKNLFSSASETYGYSPVLNLPLLDWNKLKNNIELQKTEKDIAYTNYKQTVLNAITELKKSFSAFNSATRAYNNKLKALSNMQKVVDLTLKRYESGMVEFSELLTAEQNLLQSQKDVISAQAQIAKSAIAFYKASGATIYN